MKKEKTKIIITIVTILALAFVLSSIRFTSVEDSSALAITIPQFALKIFLGEETSQQLSPEEDLIKIRLCEADCRFESISCKNDCELRLDPSCYDDCDLKEAACIEDCSNIPNTDIDLTDPSIDPLLPGIIDDPNLDLTRPDPGKTGTEFRCYPVKDVLSGEWVFRCELFIYF